jgi:hypothetical protein
MSGLLGMPKVFGGTSDRVQHASGSGHGGEGIHKGGDGFVATMTAPNNEEEQNKKYRRDQLRRAYDKVLEAETVVKVICPNTDTNILKTLDQARQAIVKMIEHNR